MMPKYPFQCVCADFFQYEERYLNPTPTMMNLPSVEAPTQPLSTQQSQPTTLPVAIDNTHKPSETPRYEEIREIPTKSLEAPNHPDTPSQTSQKMPFTLC